MAQSKTLPTTVDALTQKAREHKQAENTQYHVSVARHNIREVNSELDDLAARLRDLRYYKTVLERAFDGSAPTMTGNVVQMATKVSDVSQSELLNNVQSENVDGGETDLANDSGGSRDIAVELTPAVETHISQIRSAKTQVKQVTDSIETDLKTKQQTWTTKVSAAEELQRILGGQNKDFARTLNHMQALLNRKLLDSSGRASSFVSEWKNAIKNWEEHQSLQSFDDFQAKHDLSDETVEDVKTLSKSQTLTLADVSLETLKEMKRVDELEAAVKLSL